MGQLLKGVDCFTRKRIAGRWLFRTNQIKNVFRVDDPAKIAHIFYPCMSQALVGVDATCYRS